LIFKIASFNINGILAHDEAKLSQILSDMSIHDIDVMAVQETHLNSLQKTNQFYKTLYKYYGILNNDVNHSHTGTAILTKYRYKKGHTNINIVPGRLQLTSLNIHGCKTNIINIYNSSGERHPEIDKELLDQVTDLTTKLKYEPTIVIGDFNFNSFKPNKAKTKRWTEVLNNNGFCEKESENPSYIRRDNNTIKKSRVDHIFTNNLIEVRKEESIGFGVNDHICLLFTVKIHKIRSWKRTISEPIIVAKEIENALKSGNTETDLEIVNQKIKTSYTKKLYPSSNLFRESLTIKNIKKQIHSIINSQNIEPDWKDKIQRLKTALNVRYKKEFNTYKEKWLKYINTKDTKHLYKFDGWMKRKEINWNNLPKNITLESTLNYFQEKFSTNTHGQSTSFKIPTSTIEEGPKFTRITEKDVKEALKRMKSKSCGPDHISLDTINRS